MGDGQSSSSSGSGPAGSGFSLTSPGLFMHDSLSFNLGLGFHDDPSKSLPPFSTFGVESDFEGLTGRLLDIGLPVVSGQTWDFYGENLTARLTDLSNPNTPGQQNQNGNVQYRPWESKNDQGSPTILELGKIEAPPSSEASQATPNNFQDTFAALNNPRLPSFQSQFPAYIPGQEPSLPHTIPVFLQHPPTSLQSAPPSTKEPSPSNYEEKHITLLSGTGGAIVTPNKSPTIVPERVKENKPFPPPPPQTEHFLSRQFPENPRITSSPVEKPDRRRKPRVELSALEQPGETAAQVPSISSSEMGMMSGLVEGFRSNSMVMSDIDSIPGCDDDRPVKKKRKRCGECAGCMKKDNCGECAPCKNDKSHQICKMRRCAKLTEKKPKPTREGRGRSSMNPMQNQLPGQGPPMPGMGQFFMQNNPQQPAPSIGDPMAVRPNHGTFIDSRFQQGAWPSPPQTNQWENYPPPLVPIMAVEEQRFQHFPEGQQPQQFRFNGQQPGFQYQHDQFVHFTQRSPSGMHNQPRQSPQTFSPHGMTSPHPSPQSQNQRSQNYMEISSGGNGQFQPGSNFQPEQSPSSNSSGLRQEDDPSFANNWNQQQFHDQTSRRDLNNKIKEMIMNKHQPQTSPESEQWFKGQEYLSYENFQQGNGETVSLNVNIKSEETTIHQDSSKSDHFLVQGHPRILLKSEGGNANSDDSTVLPDSTTGSPGQNEQKSQFSGKTTSLEISSARPFDIRYIVSDKTNDSDYLDLGSMQFRGAFQKPNGWNDGTSATRDKLKSDVQVKDECPCGPADQMPLDCCPVYTQLGASDSVQNLRKLLENRFGIEGSALRFEKVTFTGKEGKTFSGCPMAKWVLRRSSSQEKVMCLIRQRLGHLCSLSWIVIAIVVWEGLPISSADRYYEDIIGKIAKSGISPTRRRCDVNPRRTCLCQGTNNEESGGSFTFGCTWSMFYNGCKFARSKNARKFKVPVKGMEAELESMFNCLCDDIGHIFAKYSPEGYERQMLHSTEAGNCRLGNRPGPFAGVTACMDFCAHAHKDRHDLVDGVTVVATLTKNRDGEPKEDEQLHVLPLYILDPIDENSVDPTFYDKVANGAIEILERYPRDISLQPPVAPCGLNNRTKTSPGSKIQEKDISSTCKPRTKRRHPKVASPLNDKPLAVSLDQWDSAVPSEVESSRLPRASATKKVTKKSKNYVSFGSKGDFTRNGMNVMPYNNLQSENIFHSDSTSNFCETYFEPNVFTNSLNVCKFQCPSENPLEQYWDYGSHLLFSESMQGLPNSLPLFSAGSHVNCTYFEHSNAKNEALIPLSDGTEAGVISVDISQAPEKDCLQHKEPDPQYTNLDRRYPQIDHNYHLSMQPISESDPYSSPLWGESGLPSTSLNFPDLSSPSSSDLEPGQSAKAGSKLQVVHTDCKENFTDPSVGGVAIALTHGSVLFECARHELHATTALKKPNRKHPTRLSLVFFHHKNLNLPDHGFDEYAKKKKLRPSTDSKS
ncbi:methylcytosine dioxygenase TET-like isoform X2 [Artemia franciscana]|uniref:Methylcytosine dioxygenase TET n=2 Tax=Artemia franciscana TaxID=6661 RepID=A0AA88I7E6_ARTSF|nr:hypothetical protein QYM36_000133 [Artemia franciscana]